MNTSLEHSTQIHHKEILKILLGACLACGIIAYFDGFAPVPYLYKAIGKNLAFLSLPFWYWKTNENVSFRPLFLWDKKTIRLAFSLGFFAFTVILGSYFTLGFLVDFKAVVGELDKKMHINESNFLFVFFYIALCNSFLEEFFFRGFLFLRLKEHGGRLFGYITSSIIFALYHIGIMATWFSWWVFAICMLSLVLAGMVFNYLVERSQSLYPAWISHGCANFAINTVGAILIYS